jgi:hypothetical protein
MSSSSMPCCCFLGGPRFVFLGHYYHPVMSCYVMWSQIPHAASHRARTSITSPFGFLSLFFSSLFSVSSLLSFLYHFFFVFPLLLYLPPSTHQPVTHPSPSSAQPPRSSHPSTSASSPRASPSLKEGKTPAVGVTWPRTVAAVAVMTMKKIGGDDDAAALFREPVPEVVGGPVLMRLVSWQQQQLLPRDAVRVGGSLAPVLLVEVEERCWRRWWSGWSGRGCGGGWFGMEREEAGGRRPQRDCGVRCLGLQQQLRRPAGAGSRGLEASLGLCRRCARGWSGAGWEGVGSGRHVGRRDGGCRGDWWVFRLHGFHGECGGWLLREGGRPLALLLLPLQLLLRALLALLPRRPRRRLLCPRCGAHRIGAEAAVRSGRDQN